MTKKGYVLILIILLVFSIVASVFAETGIVSTGGGTLNMRKSPDIKGKIVTKLKNGSKIEILGIENEWLYISYDNKEGYVQKPYVKVPSEAIGKTLYSNGETVYINASTTDDSAIVGMINAQEAIKVEKIDGDWAYVSTENGSGYILLDTISDQNEAPVAQANQVWATGTLKKKTDFYSKPDKKSTLLGTINKDQVVMVSSYDKNWCLLSWEGDYGFASKSNIEIEDLPVPEIDKRFIDEEKIISEDEAKQIAVKALQRFDNFHVNSLSCKCHKTLSANGIYGPLYCFNYYNKDGKYVFAAYVHAYSGEVLYKGDYTDFNKEKDIADIKTAPPKNDSIPLYRDPAPTPTPEPNEVDIGKEKARSIADRFLGAKYPLFDSTTFSKVNVRINDNPDPNFRSPFYIIDYFVYLDNDENPHDELEYEIIIYAYTGEIEYYSYSSLGEGNG